MAARLQPRHQDHVRAKIQASVIVDYLQKHVAGKHEMSSTQVQAALGLLKKSVADLSAVELSGANGGPIQTVVNIHFGAE